MREESVWAEISLAQLTKNAAAIQQLVGHDVSVMAVVKSNAYGHGLIQSTMALWSSGVEWFAVANIEEAITLREAGLKAPILILGYVPAGQLPEAIRLSLSLTLTDLTTAHHLSKLASHWGIPALVHLKVDTGLHRLGFEPSEISSALTEIISLPGLQLEGLYSHFADVDNDADYTAAQIQQFEDVLFDLQRAGIALPMVHLVASGGIMKTPDAYFDAVRPGRILYGLDPVPDGVAPVLTLKTRVALVKKVGAGQSVGYARLYTADKPKRIAVLPVGYFEALPRSLSNVGQVLIAGRHCPMVGRVCMNMCMVDVSHLPVMPQIGEEVVLIGSQGTGCITAGEVATWAGTNEREIVSRINPLVTRLYDQ